MYIYIKYILCKCMHSYTSSCLGMLKNCPAFIHFFHTVEEAWTVGPTWAGDWEVKRTFASFQKSRDRLFFWGGGRRASKGLFNSMDMEDIPDGPKKNCLSTKNTVDGSEIRRLTS